MYTAPEEAPDDAVLKSVRLITARGPLASLRRGLIALFMVTLLLVVPLLLAVAFFNGAFWATDALLPILNNIGPYTLAAVVFIATPLAFFRRTRAAAGVGYFIASFVFGATLWLTALLISYFAWGTLAVFIGLFICGVGVVPVALLATALHGVWSQFCYLLFLAVLTFGMRVLGQALAESSSHAT